MSRLRDAPECGVSVLLGLALIALGCIVSLYDQDWKWLIATGAFATLLVGWTIAIAWFSRTYLSPRPYWQCRRCRYDRRGLAPDARCPECGAR